MSNVTTKSSENLTKEKYMRAYSVQRFGEAAGIHNLPVPFAEEGILVRVKYAGVIPVDYKLIERLTAASTFPFIIGVDFAGVVEDVPSGEHNFKTGDRIFGQSRTHGAYAEFTKVIPGKNTEPFTHIPEGVSFEQAAVLPVPAITSYGSLDLLALSPGQSVVILGALGGVGGYAIEMSKLRGLYIIATVRGDTEEALRLGAKEAYDINQADVYPAIHKAHPKGVDGVLDLVNGPDAIRRNIEILKPGGSLVSGIYAADPPWFAGHQIKAYNISSNTSRISSPEGLKEIAHLLAEGKITSRIRSSVDLDDAGKLLEKLKHGGIRGKTVIRITNNQ